MTADSAIDYARVRQNIKKMRSVGAPDQDIDNYLSDIGVDFDALKSTTPTPTPQATPSISSAGPIDDATPDVAEAPGMFQKRMDIVRETRAARDRGEMGGITAVTTPIGQAAGFGLDVMGAAASAVIPEPIKRGAGAVGQAISNIPTRGEATFGDVGGAAVRAGQEAFGAFERRFPTWGRVVRDVANVGLLTGPVRGRAPVAAEVGIKRGPVGQFADIVATGKRRDQSIRDKLRPEGVKARKAEVPYTEVKGKGPFKRKEVTPSNYTKSVEDEFINMSGLNARMTNQEVYNVAQGVVNKERAAIEKALEGKGITNKQTVESLVTNATNKALEQPIFKGDASAGNVARGMIDEFRIILDKHPGNARGLHDARIEYDKVMRDFYPNLMNPVAAKNVRKVVNKAIRDEVNDTIDKLAPDVGYKAYRDKTSRLLTGMDTLKTKAAKEVVGIGERIKQFGKKSAQMNALAAPIFAGAGAAFYTTKAGITLALDAIEVGIRTIKDPKALAQLRADKIALSEYAKTFDEEQPTE